MKKVVLKKHDDSIKNDCYLCCFSLLCINPCKLPKGYYYTEVNNKK